MLTCKDFLRELSEFLDESLDSATKQELQQHVNDCPNCWVVMDTTKQTINVYKGMEPQEIPEEMHSKLMDALKKRIAAKKCCDKPHSSTAPLSENS